MKGVRYAAVNVVQTLLRVLPFPCKTGLIMIGNPGRDAPVFLTGNFRLTVERVKRALEGISAYLLVANSRGVNVWCAATGGLLTNHDVVSVLKTSGVDDLVDHRQVILPQLAATGIEGKVVRERTGWKVLWGPAYAETIPDFLRNRLETTPEMRAVTFPWPQRLEMAVAWAFPISLVAFLVFPWWREAVLPLMGLVWLLSMAIFLPFPLYAGRLRVGEKNLGFVSFDFGPRGGPLVLWGLFIATLGTSLLIVGAFSWALLLRWGFSALVIVLLLSLDLMGSTPTYKSGLHEDRLLRITLDEAKCKGAGFCEQVCPVNVFEVDQHRRLATLPRATQCVQCGACIVQCPFDALYFTSPTGDVVLPDSVRTFKLNLMGKRLVQSGGGR